MSYSHRDIRRTVVALIAMPTLVVCAMGRPRAACGQAVWELTPYRFHVYLAAPPVPEFPPDVVEKLGSDLVDRVDTAIGAAWTMTVSAPEPLLHRAMLWELDALNVDAIPEDALANDKVTLVAIVPQANGFDVVARELDVQTRVFSALVRKTAPQGALLSDTLFSAVVEAFAPLASIKGEVGDKVEMRLRAGRLQSRDPSLLAVLPGAVFQPIIRYDDREGKPKQILPLPWTFLAVEQVDQARLTCRIYSGLHSPLAGRRRGRVRQLALAVKPPARPTRLTLQARSGSHRPLGGYDVFLQKPGEKATELLGRTDLAGSILVPPAPHLLHILYVRNGGQLVARLPLVPGVEESVVASVIDDDQRLAAESVVMAAQEELLDLFTRRAVLTARISAAIEAGNVDRADELLVELYGLKTRDQFTQELDLQRKRLVSDDPLIRRRIDLMFDETRKLVVQYLDPNEVDKIGNQVRVAKEAADSRSGE